MIRYYKSRLLGEPVVYVEEDAGWKSYAPGGVILKHEGPLPQYVLLGADPVTLTEVIDLIQACEREAARKDRERPARPPAVGIGGWLVLPVVGLYLTILWSIYAIARDLPTLWRAWGILTTPGSGAYHPLFGPYIAFASFVQIFLPICAIFLLWLVHTKKRILPTVIVYVYAFLLFVMVIDFVAVVTFISQFLADHGRSSEASSLLSQEVTNVSRTIIATGIWIPYFLFSKRVRSTFTQPWSEARETKWHTETRRSAIADLAAESRQLREDGTTAGVTAGAPAGPAASPTAPVIPDGPPAAPAMEPPWMPADAEQRPVRPAEPARPRKILMIPVIGMLVIAMGLVAGLGAWRSANPLSAHNSGTVNAGANGDSPKHYSNADFSFSFDYPAGWILRDAGSTGTPSETRVALFDPAGETVDGLAADSATIGALKLTAPGSASLADMRTGIETSFRNGAAAEGLDIVTDFTDTTLGGLPALAASCRSVTSDGSRVIVPIYYVLGKGYLYFISLNYTDRPTDSTKAKLDALLSSFRAAP